MFCAFSVWHHLSRIQNSSFITLRKLIKAPQSIVYRIIYKSKATFLMSYLIYSYNEELFASINKIFILPGRLGARLSFYGILAISWYFLIF